VLLVTLLLLAGQGVCQAILQQRLAAARQEAKATLALAGAFGRQQRQQDFPAFRQRERGTAIDALNRLSKALPDDSWTDSVDIASAGTGLAIDVQGHAADAARLLALLEAQGFSGAEFRAPITRDEGGAQRFHLAARVPGAAHAAP
jgi:hypothetical protein